MASSRRAPSGTRSSEQHADTDAGSARPSSPRSTAHLTETRSGWLLTLTLDPQAVQAIQQPLSQRGRVRLDAGQVTVSISPNLVPGHPFTLEAIDLAISDHQPTTN